MTNIQPHIILAFIHTEQDISTLNFSLSPLTNNPYIITIVPDGEHFQDTANAVLNKRPTYRYIVSNIFLKVYGRGTAIFFHQPSMEYFVKKVVPRAFVDKVLLTELVTNILNRFCPLSSDILLISSKEVEPLRTCCWIGLHNVLEVNTNTKPATYVRHTK
jgi:hypothetical protein